MDVLGEVQPRRRDGRRYRSLPTSVEPPGREPCPAPHLVMMVCHPGVGGMERFCRFLAGAMLRAGWRVTVGLSGRNVYARETAAWPGRMNIDRLDWLDADFAGDRRYRVGRILRHRAWFRSIRPDVVLFVQSSNTPFRASVAAAATAGVPVVITHRTMAWPVEDSPRGRYLFGLLPGLGLHRRRVVLSTLLTAALARRVVFNSHQVRRGYESLYHYPPARCRVIPNAVRADVPVACHLHQSEYKKGNEWCIGYVGRLAPEKRLDVLLHAVAGLPAECRYRLRLWGEGPAEAPLRELAARLGIAGRVSFAGPTDEVAAAYAGCDVLVLCSPRESSSNMVLEAMAAGRPVIVPRTGGCPELVDYGRAGLIVPPLDVAALTAALLRLWRSPGLSRELAARARHLALTRHAPDRIAGLWVRTLSEAAGLIGTGKRGVEPCVHLFTESQVFAGTGETNERMIPANPIPQLHPF